MLRSCLQYMYVSATNMFLSKQTILEGLEKNDDLHQRNCDRGCSFSQPFFMLLRRMVCVFGAISFYHSDL